MTRSPAPGQCVHCFNTFQALTWDHVFPRSWYPDSTPENLKKWKVPACRECNKRLGEIEERLLFRFALCLDPQSLAAKGIPQKILRSANAFLAKNEKDRHQRQARREKLLRELVTFETIPSPGVLPGFGGRPGIQGYAAVRIPDDELRALVMKIVKGLAYRLESQILSGLSTMSLNIHVFCDSLSPGILLLHRSRIYLKDH